MRIVYLIYNGFIIFELKVVLIIYSWSKAASEAVENTGLKALISPTLAVPWSEGDMGKQMMATTPNSSYRGVVSLTVCSFYVNQ